MIPTAAIPTVSVRDVSSQNSTRPNQPGRLPGYRRVTVAWALFAIDALLVLIAGPVVLWLEPFGPQTALAQPLYLTCPLADLLLLYAMGLYRRDALADKSLSAPRVPVVVAMGMLTAFILAHVLAWLAPGLFAAGEPAAVLPGLALAFAGFTVCAVTARMILDVMLRRRWLRRQLLVVGAGGRAWDLLRMLTKEGSSLNYEMAFLHDPALGPLDPRLVDDPAGLILPMARLRVLDAARQVSADQIVIAPDERRGMDLEQLLACKKAGFPVVQYLSFVEKEIRRVDIKRMDLGWLVFSEGFSFGALDRFFKRAFDLAVSLIVLLVTAPLILCGIAAIRAESAGPVFYRQERVTLDGRIFRILKLRTMRVDAEANGAVWAREKDNRITRAGLFLRRTRIDELPQLINILSGDMSFVGPRPERPVFVEELASQIPLYRERHMVKAGLTGWAQINYPYGASVDDARSKLSYDLFYVKNFSVFFDFVILLQTLRVVLWPGGVR